MLLLLRCYRWWWWLLLLLLLMDRQVHGLVDYAATDAPPVQVTANRGQVIQAFSTGETFIHVCICAHLLPFHRR